MFKNNNVNFDNIKPSNQSLSAKKIRFRDRNDLVLNAEKESGPKSRTNYSMINDTIYYLINIYLDKFRNIFWIIFVHIEPKIWILCTNNY